MGNLSDQRSRPLFMQEKTRTCYRNALITVLSSGRDAAGVRGTAELFRAARLPPAPFALLAARAVIAFDQRQTRVNGLNVMWNRWLAGEERLGECG